jgi:peptide/nickel transport system permease protein
VTTAAETVVTDPVSNQEAGGKRAQVLRSIFARPLTVGIVGYLVLVCLVALFAGLLAPYDPTSPDLANTMADPSGEHWLGTDMLGRDLLSRLMYGARYTLLGALQAVVTVMCLGVPIGLLAGYVGGWTDRTVTWVIDILMAVPGLVMLLIVHTLFGGSQTAAMITLGILGAPGMARVVRGATLSVRNELYISAARVSGLSTGHVIVHHILPRVIGPIIVRLSLFAGVALLVETGLGYLGFGAQPPMPSWGNMVGDASTAISQHPWMLVPSGAAIALTILAFGLLGDAIRDATTERVRRPVRITRSQRSIRATVPAAVDGRGGATDATDGAATRSLLRVTDLSVSLGDEDGNEVTVVEGVSLAINPGETVGLVGESGCGKSITGKAILGLLPRGGQITEGSVSFDGKELTTLTAKQLRSMRGAEVSLISQEPIASLDPVFTVGSLLGEVIRRHDKLPRKAVTQRAIELLRSVNLNDPEQVLKRYPHQLSGGMAQRVAIAMALAGRPRLLIADEPTTALDVTVQAEILALLRRLQRDTGMAILLISHDWGVIADLCQRAYVMYAGHVVETASTLQLFDQPRHPYSLGLLECTPGRGEAGTLLPAIRGSVPDPKHWPSGCHFAPRCRLATDDCSAGPVPFFNPAVGHLSRCLHHDQLTREEHVRV